MIDLEQIFRRAGLDPDPIDVPADNGCPDEDEAEIEEEEEEEEEDAAEDEAATPLPRLRSSPDPLAPEGPPIRSYFLGSIILEPSNQGEGLFLVYDGQQRLTTLGLLISVLRDRVVSDAASSALAASLLLRHGEPRLEFKTEGGAVKRITRTPGQARWSGHAKRSPADRRLYGGVDRIRSLITKWSSAKCSAFLRFLQRDVHVTVTFMRHRRLAELAYLTTNQRGLPLETPDVVKGYIVRMVSDLSPGNGQVVSEAWETLRRDTGRHFEALLRAVDFMHFGQPRNNDFGTALMDQFPAGPHGAELAMKWVLQDLPEYWEAFQPIVEPEANYRELYGVPLWLKQLGFLGWTEWQAVALVMKTTGRSRDRDRNLHRLQRTCFVMHLLGWATDPQKRANALYQAIQWLEAGKKPFREPNRKQNSKGGPLFFGRDRRSQARAALASPMPDHAVYRPVVRWAETILWLDAEDRVPVQAGQGSVEHVLPRTHGHEWHAGFPDEVEREQSKNLLGNLCMLPADVNRALSNHGFEDKVSMLRTLKPRWRSAHNIATHETWSVRTVKARTERLADQLIHHLRIRERSRRPIS